MELPAKSEEFGPVELVRKPFYVNCLGLIEISGVFENLAGRTFNSQSFLLSVPVDLSLFDDFAGFDIIQSEFSPDKKSFLLDITMSDSCWNSGRVRV